ncbi:STAS domain-containing protein [Bailinhaonella thermotolerans]|uniref:Anti-sigma factor antagonist n=1 Tax=Bailinhaonella thermotolerans TaxID=1070861 RepID=A0A3A4A738_9ACTN|nr:STAS domain-containing protein [Bailinhaonella thermotolerans]RJL24766.1 anti-sigma factor antagonist [Bailinhaonella thermotolerans]
MRLRLDHRVEDDHTVVGIAGEIDVFTAPRLREYLTDLIMSGGAHLVLDMAEVAFLDSAGLGVLIGTLRRLQVHDGTLAVINANHHVLKVFRTTRLDRVIEVSGDADAGD